MFNSIRNNAIFNGFSQPKSIEDIRREIRANSDLHIKNVRQRIKKNEVIEKAVEPVKEPEPEVKAKPEVKKEDLRFNESRLGQRFKKGDDGTYAIENRDVDTVIKSLLFSADSMDLKKKVTSEDFRSLVSASRKTRRPFFVKANNQDFQFNFIEL